MLLLLGGDIHPNPGPTNKPFSICHLNINSLYVRSDTNSTYKIDEIYSRFCIHDKYEVICLTETWLNPSIPDSLIELPGYILYRRDRPDGYGGVAVYVDKNIQSHIISNMCYNHVENLWISMVVGNRKCFVGVYYRAPCSDSQRIRYFLDEFNEHLHRIYLLKPDLFCITGDFNDRRSSWSDNHNNSDLSDLTNMFYDTI